MQDEQMCDEVLQILKDDLEKGYSHQQSEYLQVRAGRANPHILDKVAVDYYGTMTPISQMANIAVPEARMLVISVWDQSQVRNVCKAISMANLGIEPNDDGKIIRMIFPALTEDRRKDIVKQIKKIAEETKVTMRNARRDAIEVFRQMKKDGEISEDELANFEKEIQKSLDNYNLKVDELSLTKEKEIMEI